MSPSSPSVIFLDVESGLNAKASAATSVFQSLIRSVYCGASRDPLAGDDVFSRDRLRARFDPDLPVGVDVAERQMIAFNAVDDALADHGGVDHVRHHDVEYVGEQQIGARSYHAVLLTQHIDQFLGGAGGSI